MADLDVKSTNAEFSLPPRTQANFLGIYSALYTGVYTAFAWRYLPESLPPKHYWFWLVALYGTFWAPLHIQRFKWLPIIGLVARVLGALAVRILDLLRVNTGADITAPPKDAGSILRPDHVIREPGSRWPVFEAGAVQLLAAGVIVMTAWYTTFSGGPFQSPYGQVLLALPLLSPHVAHKPTSIGAVYATTVLAALWFSTTAHRRLPPIEWYTFTTLGVLTISLLVASGTRWRDVTTGRTSRVE